MTQAAETRKDAASLPFFGIPRILPYVKKYKKTLQAMLLCGMIGSAMDIALPLFQRYALNHFITLGTLDTLPWFIIIYALAIVFASCANYVACRGAMTTEVSVNRDLRNAAFNHLQTLSFSYFNQNSVGWIHSRVMSDTSRIGGLVSWSCPAGPDGHGDPAADRGAVFPFPEEADQRQPEDP